MATEPNRIMLEPSAAVAAASLSKHRQRPSGGGVEEEKEELDILLVDVDTELDHTMNMNMDPSLVGFVHSNFQQRGGGGGGYVEQDKADVGDENGFRAQLESVTRALFGSCGSAIETAASFFVQEHSSTCSRWPNHHGSGAVGVGGVPHRGAAAAAAAGLVGIRRASHVMQHGHQHQQHYHYQQQQHQAKPALSIADELRQLAIAEGRNPNAVHVPQQPRSADIPKFLGEDAVHSIDDDNISAISQHTLEDMARKGYVHVHPMCGSSSSRDRQASSISNSSNNNSNNNNNNNSNNNMQDVEEEPPPSPTRTRSLSTSSSCKDRRRKANGTRAEC